jgi:hypothetical protein
VDRVTSDSVYMCCICYHTHTHTHTHTEEKCGNNRESETGHRTCPKIALANIFAVQGRYWAAFCAIFSMFVLSYYKEMQNFVYF